MTGFGSAEERGNGFAIAVDLRAVNHRYFKIQSRVSDELASLAGPAEAEIRKRVRRGAVAFSARLVALAEESASSVNESLLRSYVELCRKVVSRYKLADRISVADLLHLPGVVQAPQDAAQGTRAPLEPVFRRALARALAALDTMREKEGAALRREFLRRTKKVRRLLGPIEKGLPGALEEAERRLFDRVEEFLSRRGLSLAPGELAREVAVIAERADVAEEIERLKSHAAQTEDLLEAGGEIGRQLDFLTQEMLREVTTMAAKIASSSLAQRVLDLKVEIDRLREQAQNVE